MIKKIVDYYLEKKGFFIIYKLGNAVGDQLLLTGVCKEIYEKYNYKIIILAKYKELFLNNKYIYKFFNLRYNFISRVFLFIFKYFVFKNIRNYSSNIKNTNNIFALRNYQNIHLAEFHSLNLGLNLSFDNYSPVIEFSKNEEKFFENKFKHLKDFAIIQPEAKKTFTENKDWGFEKFQEVVNKTKQINWLQFSIKKEKKLNGIYKNIHNPNFREIFYLVRKSNFIFCLEGLYHHIAAAFKKKNFLLLSGFLNKKNIIYPNCKIIENFKNLECAPCYKLSKCNINGKPCTNGISVDAVIKNILS